MRRGAPPPLAEAPAGWPCPHCIRSRCHLVFAFSQGVNMSCTIQSSACEHKIFLRDISFCIQCSGDSVQASPHGWVRASLVTEYKACVEHYTALAGATDVPDAERQARMERIKLIETARLHCEAARAAVEVHRVALYKSLGLPAQPRLPAPSVPRDTRISI